MCSPTTRSPPSSEATRSCSSVRKRRPVPLPEAAVAGERIKLEVQERETVGSTESARLRREGFIPGVIYGRGKKPHAIAVPERALRAVLGGPHGQHAILDVVLGTQKRTHASILMDYQGDPIRGRARA